MGKLLLYLVLISWALLPQQVLAGAVTMTGCTMLEINIFAFENGMGLAVAVLGGTLVVNFLNSLDITLAGVVNAVGEAFLVVGESA